MWPETGCRSKYVPETGRGLEPCLLLILPPVLLSPAKTSGLEHLGQLLKGRLTDSPIPLGLPLLWACLYPHNWLPGKIRSLVLPT